MKTQSIPDADALGITPEQRSRFEALALTSALPGRVVSEAKGEYRVWAAQREYAAECTGRLFSRAAGRADLPAVGDWVAIEPIEASRALVRALLPRATKFSRRAAGHNGAEQVVAANVDTVFITMGLDGDFNVRRAERYLAVSWESGATPAVVLTKSDLAPDATEKVAALRALAGRARVIPTSVVTGAGVDEVRALCEPARTVAFLGSSGVGKSTLANVLLGSDAMRTGDVREHDQRGKHTTTHRELFVLPSGALLIDTPGMRELQLWDVDRGLDAAFEDVTDLAARCHFRDCAHAREPGCAVRAALDAGALDRERFASWKKLHDEAAAAREARVKRGRR